MSRSKGGALLSEPGVATGRTQEKECSLCGKTVKADEYAGIWGKTAPWLSLHPHDAPCGVPCFGAGTRGGNFALFKAGKMHGTKRAPCPKCGFEPPTS